MARSKMINCKVCGAEIAKSAKVCPQCGAKNKKKNWWVKVILIAICLLLIKTIIDSGNGNLNNETSNTKLPRSEYISMCQPADYDSVARNPNDYRNKYLTFKGTVVQVLEGSPLTLRINQENKDVFANDTWYITYSSSSNESRILEDDVIIVYGRCTGITSYKSIFGQKITVPSMVMEYYEIEE